MRIPFARFLPYFKGGENLLVKKPIYLVSKASINPSLGMGVSYYTRLGFGVPVESYPHEKYTFCDAYWDESFKDTAYVHVIVSKKNHRPIAASNSASYIRSCGCLFNNVFYEMFCRNETTGFFQSIHTW